MQFHGEYNATSKRYTLMGGLTPAFHTVRLPSGHYKVTSDGQEGEVYVRQGLIRAERYAGGQIEIQGSGPAAGWVALPFVSPMEPAPSISRNDGAVYLFASVNNPPYELATLPD